jgi:hypothetical protein
VRYEAFGVFRTENAAAKHLTRAAQNGVGNLHIAKLTA